MRKKHSRQILRQPFATTPEGEYGYVTMFQDMIKSDAYAVLSGNACKVYIVLRSKYYGKGPPIVECAYSTFKKHGMNEHAVSKGTAELEALGFITVSRHGGYPNITTQYTFSDKWKTIDVRQAKKVFEAKWKANHKSKTFKK